MTQATFTAVSKNGTIARRKSNREYTAALFGTPQEGGPDVFLCFGRDVAAVQARLNEWHKIGWHVVEIVEVTKS
jgi:hypothetical protein